MLLSFIRGDFSLTEFLSSMLFLLPGLVVALTLHEAAHAWTAYRAGDPTAKYLGRLTLNPLKHLDRVGFLMLLFIGIGYARPVPVNPNNFRHGRRDDLLVSMAGIISNLLQFVLACVIMFAMVSAAFNNAPGEMRLSMDSVAVTIDGGVYSLGRASAFRYFYSMGSYLVAPVMGRAAGWAFEILLNYCVLNVSLAIFNLLPIPPLDGYHLFNDIILKRSFFASQKAQRIGQAAVLVLVMSGVFSKIMSAAVNFLLSGAGSVMVRMAGA